MPGLPQAWRRNPGPRWVIYEDELIYISRAMSWGDEKDHYLGHEQHLLILVLPRK
jgi:hypothetical protein